MPSPNATPTPVTPPRVPLIDPRSGQIDRAWYLFFVSLMNTAIAVYNSDVGPSPESLIASYDAALQALAQNVDTQPLPVDLSAELTKQIEAAGLTNYATGLLSQIAEMQKQIEALNLLPVPISGSVTSVGLSAPAIFTVSGSPVTSSGTLALTYSGTALPTANGGTGLTSFTANGVAYASSSSVLATGSALTFDGSTHKVQTASGTAPKYWLAQTGISAWSVGSPASTDALVFINEQFGSEKMRIASGGIVTMSAYGAGAATFSAAGVISSVSDETWKVKDGIPADPDAMLKKLQPGYWYYNDEKKEIFGKDRQLGFYAQNVNAAIGPEAAPEPEEGKPWGYYDRSVLAVAVMSLQKALDTIDSLTARIAALEQK